MQTGKPYYALRIAAQGLDVRISANDVPLAHIRPAEGAAVRQDVLNSWLINGPNVVAVSVAAAAPAPPAAPRYLRVSVAVADDPARPITDFNWPPEDDATAIPAAPPFSRSLGFVVPTPLGPWAMDRAARFPQIPIPEQDLIVSRFREIHNACARRDISHLTALARIRTEELADAYGFPHDEFAHMSAADWQRFVAGQLLPAEPVRASFRFETQRRGSVVRLTRTDGSDPLQATLSPRGRMSSPMWFSKINNAWEWIR